MRKDSAMATRRTITRNGVRIRITTVTTTRPGRATVTVRRTA